MLDYDEILEEAYSDFIVNMLGIEPMEEGARFQVLKVRFSQTNKAFNRALKDARKQYKHGEYTEALTSIKTSKEHLKTLQSMASEIPDNKIIGFLNSIWYSSPYTGRDKDRTLKGYVDKDGSKKYISTVNMASKTTANQRTIYVTYLKRMERDIEEFEKMIKDKQRKATKESFDDFDIFGDDFDLI